MNLKNLNVILHKKAWTMRFVLLLLFLDSSMPCITSRAYFFHWCYFELLFVETSTMCTSLLAVCGQNPLIMSMGWSIFGSTISEYSYTIVVFPTQFSFFLFWFFAIIHCLGLLLISCHCFWYNHVCVWSSFLCQSLFILCWHLIISDWITLPFIW